MKIDVTYEEADLKRIILADLARQGIPATAADIKLSKGKATVSVEVSGNEMPPAHEPSPEHVQQAPRAVPVAAVPAPALEVVEGGASPVDMSDVFRQSQKIVTSKEGKFPVPDRQLMHGESFDFPENK